MKERERVMLKEKNMCVTEDCYNDKEYGDTITYWFDQWGNKRFNAPLLDLCLYCRIRGGE